MTGPTELAAILVSEASKALARQDRQPETEAVLREYRVDAKAVVIAVISKLTGRRTVAVPLQTATFGEVDLAAVLAALED